MSKYGIIVPFEEQWTWMLSSNTKLNDENLKPLLFNSFDDAANYADSCGIALYEISNYPLSISYSTNMMGPWSMNWYKDNGLTKKVKKVINNDFLAKTYSLKIGDTIEKDEIIQHYCGGRIDIRGVPFEPYGLEYGLEFMTEESFDEFSKWLNDFSSESLLSKKELIKKFEEEINHKISWFNEDTKIMKNNKLML